MRSKGERNVICNGYHSFGESCPGDSSNNFLSNLRIPSYEPPPMIEFSKPKFEPILPSYELPKPTFDFLSRPEPLIPPPSPVYNINHDLIGYKPEFENHIYVGLGSNVERLEINPGGSVRDSMGNLVGQWGPLNTIWPTNLPSTPDYGPPQSTPDVWDPGYSPMKPFG